MQADQFLNKHTISYKISQALAPGRRTPPAFLCNLVLKKVLHVILFNHRQLQNGKYYLDGEVLQPSAINLVSLFQSQ